MFTPDPKVAEAPFAEDGQIALLEHLPQEDRDAFLAAADGLGPSRAQDYLITQYRISISLPALKSWLESARQERQSRAFGAFLAGLRADVERAQEFCRQIDHPGSLERANAFVLSCKLFEALQSGDRAAILDFAQAIAAILSTR
jgi:hypothetical protein